MVQSFHGPRAQSNVSAREPVVLLTSQRFSAGGRWLSEVMGEMTAGRQDEHCENSREAETGRRKQRVLWEQAGAPPLP